jgi:integrase
METPRRISNTRALTNSNVQRFEPYILRHTAFTNLAKKGADAHTLARIAGHSSIVITMRTSIRRPTLSNALLRWRTVKSTANDLYGRHAAECP